MTHDPWPIKLRRVRTHVDRINIPSWDVLQSLLPIGSSHEAVVTRRLRDGILASITFDQIGLPCFIRKVDIDRAESPIEVGSTIRVRVVGQQEDIRAIEFELVHPD